MPTTNIRVEAGAIFAACLFFTLNCNFVFADNPIPRQGDTCPTGYYRAGDYCQPLPSSTNNPAIVKHGKDCPTGFYSAGNYCKRMSNSDREAIPRKDGGKCPTVWYQSGDYCNKQ